MKFLYPVTDVKGEFQSMEFKGMQALAKGAKKEAKKYYDRVILLDPSVDTICRVVQQYEAAGLGASVDCAIYWHLSRHGEKHYNGKDEYGNFNFNLDLMRKKHGKYMREQHQQVVKQAKHLQDQGQNHGSSVCPPLYDDSITEQTTLLKKGKPNN